MQISPTQLQEWRSPPPPPLPDLGPLPAPSLPPSSTAATSPSPAAPPASIGTRLHPIPSPDAPSPLSFRISFFSRSHQLYVKCRRRALVYDGRCRLPLVSGGLLSALPLHSAVASARLRSAIAAESRSWCLVPQGAVPAYMFLEGLDLVVGLCTFGGIGSRSRC